MKRKRIIAIGLVVVLMAFALVGCSGDATNSSSQSENQEEMESLTVYSGAGLRKPMDEIGKLFEEKFNVKINYTYAGSAQNLSQIELNNEGDVYIPGAKHYIKSSIEKGFVEFTKDVSYHIPVIGVPKGNSANISSLQDLAKPDVDVILGDERAAAIGRVSQKLFKKNDIQDEVGKNVITKDATVNEVVVHTAMEQGDACIVWEDNIANAEEVEIIRISKEKNLIKTIPIGALTFSTKPELTKKFVDFVASDEGKAIFKKHGFKPVE